MFFGLRLFVRSAILSMAVFLFYLIILPVAFAQQAGVSIKPAVIEKTLDPGENGVYTLTVENLNAHDQKFYLFTKNISGVRDGGVPIFADAHEVTGYELVDWITLSQTEIDLPAGKSAVINFSMNVPDNASPGSHFGGVFVSVDPPEIENSGAAVAYQVANIISIRVSGEAVETASIRQFSTSKFLYGSQDIEFSVRLENTGNVLVRPVGPLEIYNMLGNKVGNLVFNEDQSGVFPKTTKSFDNIEWKGNSTGFGKYEAVLSVLYGDEGAKKTISSTVTFWILPLNIIVPTIGFLLLFFAVLYFSVKSYVRRSLAHAVPGRRIVPRRRKSNSSAMLLVVVVSLTVTALFLVVLLALFA